jgi:hypothetical protein
MVDIIQEMPVQPSTISARAAAIMSDGKGIFSIGEIQITLIIFVFGIISVLIYSLIVREGKNSQFSLRMYVVIILVFGTLLVVSSAYSTDQIAPVVGFFGTVAGYLLGKSDSRGNRDDGGSDV